MESKKVKVIKEILESCADNKKPCYKCKYYGKCEKLLDKQDILTLINELESENKQILEENESLNGSWENALKRIAELEKEVETKTNTIVDLLKKQEFYEKEKLTKFAEKLKEICIKKSCFIDIDGSEEEYWFDGAVTMDEIDELVKEYEVEND